MIVKNLSITTTVMGTFKVNAIIRQAGFVKQDGYGVAKILAIMNGTDSRDKSCSREFYGIIKSIGPLP